MSDRVEELLAAGRPRGANLDAIVGSIEQTLFGSGAPPTHIGRYQVLRRLGAGAHATVYAVHDPRLDREVALKMLHRPMCPVDRQRLVREARALAAVDHPNLVNVFDTGTHRDTTGAVGTFVVMELVDGPTLQQRLQRRPCVQQVMSLVMGMGRGLSAMHRAGLVHRDFKPSNVLLTPDGVPRVADLGLAGDRVGTEPSSSTGPVASLRGAERAVTLSQSGCVLGTPRYMAPEQHAGSRVGPAADQFALCVVIVEALIGEPPFVGESVAELARAKFRGPSRSVLRRLPSGLARILRRGLHRDPLCRWPSVDALLNAVVAETTRRRPLRWFGAAGITAVAVGGIGWSMQTAASDQRCLGAQHQLLGVWDDEQRARVRGAIARADVIYGDAVWRSIETNLDRYAQTWTELHTQTCRATAVHGAQSAAAMDRRMTCLHRAKVELNAAVQTLAAADLDVVPKAHSVLDRLRPLSRCEDEQALREAVEPPLPADVVAVEGIRALVAKAGARTAAGQYAPAQAQLAEANERLRAVSYGPVQAEVALARGMVLERLGQYEAASSVLHDALHTALRWRMWDQAQHAASWLMFVHGTVLHQPEVALRYRELAISERPHAGALEHLAGVLHVRGDYAEAEATYRQALALHLAEHPNESHQAAIPLNNLAITLLAQGKFTQAESEYRRSLALYEMSLGEAHPIVGGSHGNLGIALYRMGEYAEALTESERALSIFVDALGPKHPQVAQSRTNLGLVLAALGRYAEAEAQYRQARSAQTETLGPRHPQVATTGANLANALEAQGEYEAAEAEFRETIELLTAAAGPEHPHVATTWHNLANAQRSQGKYEEAEAGYRRALGLRTKTLGSDHPAVAASAHGLAIVLLETGRVAEALPLAEQAWERRRRADIPLERRARTAFAVAQALWAMPGSAHKRRAQDLVDEALQSYRGAGSVFAAEAADVRTWLRARTPKPGS